jgi:hypothetical protein
MGNTPALGDVFCNIKRVACGVFCTTNASACWRYIREAKFLNLAVGMNQTKQNVESAVEKGELRSQGGDDIPGKFENIKPYIDLAEIS